MDINYVSYQAQPTPKTVKTGRTDTVVKDAARLKQYRFRDANFTNPKVKSPQAQAYSRAAQSFGSAKFTVEELLDRALESHGLEFKGNGDRLKNVRYYISFLRRADIVEYAN